MHVTSATTTVALAVMAIALPQPQIAERVMGTGMAIQLTKYTQLVHANNSVNIDALHSQVASVDAKIRRGFDHYEKNTGMVHPFAVKEVGKRQSDVPLFDVNGVIWYGAIQVGMPYQTFQVAFDTASSDFLLPATNCLVSCSGHALWNPSTSRFSHYSGGPISIQFLNGETVGASVYTDIVYIAAFTAMHQTISAVTHYPPPFEFPRFFPDGMMGMGFRSIASIDASPVFQSLVDQRRVANPVFSFKLSPVGAELYIGGVNTSLYRGMFTYVPVTQAGFWQVNMDNIQVNGHMMVDAVPVIINISGDLITGPPEQVQALYHALDSTYFGSGFYTLPCDAFPTFSLTFGGTTFPVPPSSLIVGQLLDGSNRCVSGIAGSTLQLEWWVIGNRFLQHVYTTFDVGNLRVGFAFLA